LEIETTDYHTAGEPFRIVTAGGPTLRGDSVLARRRDALENHDRVRCLLVNEPRGHADMYGCHVTEPDDAGADLGVVFFHNDGYSTACGHGTIALVTWALESGRLPVTGPLTKVVVDVPSGRVETVASVATTEGAVRVASVLFRNVPSFVFARDLVIGRFTVAIAFGGAFYAILPAAQAGLRVVPAHLPQLIDLGRGVKQHLEAQLEVTHPLLPALRDIYGVIFTEGDRNVTVFANGEVDRSPCGSGTSARLALLDATGELARGDTLHHVGILGTEFLGKVVGATDVAGIPAVVTEVEGSAHLTGHHRFILEDGDPLGTGFLLR